MHYTLRIVTDPSPGAWARKLHAWLTGRGFAVLQVVAVDAAIDIDLDVGAGAPLVVELREPDPAAQAFRRTRRFLVRYRGGPISSAAQRRVLDSVVQTIEGIEDKLPSGWQGVVATGTTREQQPGEVLARQFPFAQLDRAHGDGPAIDTEVLLRLTSLCNQDCPFCSAPPSSRPSGPALHAAVDWVARNLPGVRLTLTGGEPTLQPAFFEVLHHALCERSIARITVQTNAVAFSSDERVEQLPDDPRLAFFVSMHAVQSDIYDRCTASRGQLPKALDGLAKLVASRCEVTVNTVVSAQNVAHLPEIAPLLAERLAGLPLPSLHYSVLICPPERPAAQELLVRYGELAPALESASTAAAALGFRVEPLLASTHASLPPCVVSPAERGRATHRPVILGGDTGYEDLAKPWTKARACLECALTESCLGVPTPYAERFGFDELVPLAKAR